MTRTILDTQRDLREALAISESSLNRWLKRGMPREPDGRFCLEDCKSWMADNHVTGRPNRMGAICAATKQILEKGAALVAQGKTMIAAADLLGVPEKTFCKLRAAHRDFWGELIGKAIEAVIAKVRASAGTDAILEDPDAYYNLATEAEKWANARGETLFPHGTAPTLTSFYEEYYRPLCLADATEKRRLLYRTVLTRWRLLTGDPPLAEITPILLSKFRDCLVKSRGQKPYLKKSINTVAYYLKMVQTLLDKAGPPGPRNRDAAGLIDRAPWIRRPREEVNPPRTVPTEHLNNVYLAAVAMDQPDVEGFKPPAWWRALIVLAYNTGLRKRTLFELRMEYIDWQRSRMVIPSSRLKSKRGIIVPLNGTALLHLAKIRTNRELVFPWSLDDRSFYDRFHGLQDAAGIPRAEHFGLHAIRKTFGTALWEDSPEAAQLGLGHSSIDTTVRHYVQGDGILSRALDALPQPAAFTAAGG